MSTIGELATVVRSKNAGIAHVGVDLIFEDPDAYAAACRAVDREAVARAYRIEVDRITDLVHFDEGLAIKVTLRREQVAGGEGLGESDVYGAAQYAPLATLEVDLRR